MKILGPDFFGNIVAVQVGRLGPSVDDALMSHVGALPRLEFLALGGYPGLVNGKGLKRLQGLTRLKTFYMYEAPLSGSRPGQFGQDGRP